MKTGVRCFLQLGLGLLALFTVLGVNAQTVPPYIKYQAVLRDLNGQPLQNQSAVDIRISIRQDNPAGTIAYQEDWKGLTTNAYGLVHLNIGAGTKTSARPAASLADIPWGEHALYVQIDIQTDNTGYTTMGTSELLTVPYAFMAGNASNAGVTFDLDEGVLPRYDTTRKALVNSGVRQRSVKDTLIISTTKGVEIVNPDSVATLGHKASYTFPTTAGRKDQVLMLMDGKGTLGWAYAEGGEVGPGTGLALGHGDDEHLLYWNDDDEEVKSAPLVYRYNNNGEFVLSGYLQVQDSLFVKEKIAAGELQVRGNSVFNGDAFFAGIVQIGDNTRLTGDSVITENLRAAKNIYAGDSLYVGLDARIGRDVSMGRDVEIGRDVQIGRDAAVDNNMTVGNDVQAGRDMTVVRNQTIGGNLTVGGYTFLNTDSVITHYIETDSLRTGYFSAKLAKGKVWVGDSNGRTQARHLSGIISLDSVGRTRLHIGFGTGFEDTLITSADGLTDSLLISVNYSDSIWAQDTQHLNWIYSYNKGFDSCIRVGIGTRQPEARLHVADSNVLFKTVLKTVDNDDSLYNQFIWNARKGALRVGGLTKNVMEGTILVDNSDYWDEEKIGEYSFALGWDVRATKPYSYAIGHGAWADGTYAIAIGEDAGIDTAGVVIGNNSKVLGAGNALVIGSQSTIIGTAASPADGSIAIGHNVNVTGTGSVVIGEYSAEVNIGPDVYAIGTNNVADTMSIMIGNNNEAGAGSIVIGWDNNETSYLGQSSIVISNNTRETDKFEKDESVSPVIVVGEREFEPGQFLNGSTYKGMEYNDIVIGYMAGDNIGRKISLGDGNKMEGTSNNFLMMLGSDLWCEHTPDRDLVMIGKGINEGEDLHWSSFCGLMDPYSVGSPAIADFTMVLGVDGINMAFDDQKNAYFAGTVKTNYGTFNYIELTSDYRLKENIHPISYPLSYLDSLQPVSFYLKKDVTRRKQYGFIAQEVQKYFPSLVTSAKKGGMLSMNYIGLIPMLWDFSLQLRNQNTELQKKNEDLEKRLNVLEAEIEAIKQALQNK